MNTLLRPGDRIRLVAMHDDPDPILVGQLGTVVDVARRVSRKLTRPEYTSDGEHLSNARSYARRVK